MYSINKQYNKKMANIKKQNKFLSIAKINDTIFQVDDLARIWGRK